MVGESAALPARALYYEEGGKCMNSVMNSEQTGCYKTEQKAVPSPQLNETANEIMEYLFEIYKTVTILNSKLYGKGFDTPSDYDKPINLESKLNFIMNVMQEVSRMISRINDKA
jgi:hypothetical protein